MRNICTVILVSLYYVLGTPSTTMHIYYSTGYLPSHLLTGEAATTIYKYRICIQFRIIIYTASAPSGRGRFTGHTVQVYKG